VDAIGGTPRLWLPNASGLIWADAGHLLFSEIRERIHMAAVTATVNRTMQRDVYVPPLDRGMAHRAFLSPNGKWVLLVEMENGGMLPCRLVPFDGSSPGTQVGPPAGRCYGAAWSPDGQWMYLNSNAGGTFHIWRQKFPSGHPEQVTFGPTEQNGISVDPDGRSFVTSAGITKSQITIYDERGEHQIQIEGSAWLPIGSHAPPHSFSADGRTLYFLRARRGAQSTEAELWAAHVITGENEPIVAGVEVTGYDTSADGQRVAYEVPDANAKPRLWVSALDRHVPARQLEGFQADNPCFAGDGTLFFRAVEKGFNFVYRMSGDWLPHKVLTEPIVSLRGCTSDGNWLMLGMKASPDDSRSYFVVYSLRDQRTFKLCSMCWPVWARDQKYLYVTFDTESDHSVATTYVIDLRGQPIPTIPAGGITTDNVRGLPVVKTIEHTGAKVYPGNDLSSYVIVRETAQSNIYRIPLQ
jgi:hypothetical protein